MTTAREVLSATEVASICGVGHSTARYWIRTGRLRASHEGRTYAITKDQLLFYLQSSGHEVPDQLLSRGQPITLPCFRPIQPCWEYLARGIEGDGEVMELHFTNFPLFISRRDTEIPEKKGVTQKPKTQNPSYSSFSASFLALREISFMPVSDFS